jgi:hypothetical protein
MRHDDDLPRSEGEHVEDETERRAALEEAVKAFAALEAARGRLARAADPARLLNTPDAELEAPLSDYRRARQAFREAERRVDATVPVARAG